MLASKTKAETRMAPSPTHVIAAAAVDGTCLSQDVPTAIRAPRASSQARVNGEKYAAVGFAPVWMIDHP